LLIDAALQVVGIGFSEPATEKSFFRTFSFLHPFGFYSEFGNVIYGWYALSPSTSLEKADEFICF
jgi:hypothetical protein